MVKPRTEMQSIVAYEYPKSVSDISSRYDIPKGQIIKVNFNESPYPPSPNVRKAVLSFINNGYLQWYPDESYKELRQVIAQVNKLEPGQVIVGCGSDELIKEIVFTYVDKNDEVIIPIPNFQMYEICAKAVGAKIVKVQCNDDLTTNVDGILNSVSDKTKIIFISNPNSPTGLVISRNDIVRILNKAKNALVIVDEAYYDFYGSTVADLIDDYENLIVLRTLSKAYGLASFRVGYALTSKNNISELIKTKNPFSVTQVSQIVAIAALQDQKYVKAIVKEIRKTRNYLIKRLTQLGLTVYPSKTNFLLSRFPKYIKSKYVKGKLEEFGILVRDSKDSLLANYLRISIPTFEKAQIMITKLEKILTEFGLIFDMDGVLVDVSESYRKAIIKTAEIFLANREIKTKFTNNDVQEMKNKGNVNNDWVCTKLLIETVYKGKDVILGRIGKDEIKTTFQELYLGSGRFRKIYGLKPRFNCKGLGENEKWLLNKNLLKKLYKIFQGKLGIVTGRPREEAVIALRKAKVTKYFPVIISMEDVREDKPNPEGIMEVMKKLEITQAYYIGDSIDDINAAINVNINAIGILSQSFDSLETLKQAGATQVLSTVNNLNEVFL